jgi:hypothetical protein
MILQQPLSSPSSSLKIVLCSDGLEKFTVDGEENDDYLPNGTLYQELLFEIDGFAPPLSITTQEQDEEVDRATGYYTLVHYNRETHGLFQNFVIDDHDYLHRNIMNLRHHHIIPSYNDEKEETELEQEELSSVIAMYSQSVLTFPSFLADRDSLDDLLLPSNTNITELDEDEDDNNSVISDTSVATVTQSNTHCHQQSLSLSFPLFTSENKEDALTSLAEEQENNNRLFPATTVVLNSIDIPPSSIQYHLEMHAELK